MQATQIEQLGTLERRIGLTVSLKNVEMEVSQRLKTIARNTRIPGFRPGKAPLNMVAQQHGPSVRQEAIGQSIEQAFTSAMKEHGLRVAGFPRIEPKTEAGMEGVLECYAVFEVFPEVVIGDLSTCEITQLDVAVGEAEVDNTLTVLAKQHLTYQSVARVAQSKDRVLVNFVGRIDGEAFPGGEAQGFGVILGSGQTLPEFEQGLLGVAAGESRTIPVTFPEDYHAPHLAGKTAQFAIEVTEISEPVLPAIDANFAKTLGVLNGDVAVMRADILSSLQRESQQRIKIKMRDQVFQALLKMAPLELPKILVSSEAQRIQEAALEDMKVRNVDVTTHPLSPELVEKQAIQRVSLGLIVAHIIESQKITATKEQVLAAIEALAASYEDPQAVVAWYRQTPEKMQEMTSVVLEDHVVAWVLGQAKVIHETQSFEVLMGRV